MSEHGTRGGTGTTPARTGGAVNLDDGHHATSAGLPAVFENPGLPAHVHRAADDDPRAAKRAERQVVGLFALSIIATIVFVVAYFAIDAQRAVFIPFIGSTNLLNTVLGVSLAVGLFGIGAGAVHWAKTLMPDTEVVEERHPMRSTDEDRDKAVTLLKAGGDAAQINRRPVIKTALGGALGLFALPFVVQLAGSLGPGDKAHIEMAETIWDIKPKADGSPGSPIRLVRDPELTPIKASDVSIGSVYHVMPETLKESKHVLEDKAKAAVLLMRLNPADFVSEKARDWGYQGIVAYSKICTHVGCPVGLYEQQTKHLLCPCHQSTFDVTRDCEVIFGPARRALPQLKITVDDEGYLVAPEGFTEPVGPSYWERARS